MRRLNFLSSFQSQPHDLRLLFLSLFLWTFGLGLYNYVWSIYLRNLNANPEQVGLVFSVGFAAAAVTMIPGGLLANKYDLRTILIVSWAMSIPPPIMFYLAQSWPQVLPGWVLFQLSAFGLPAFNAYISEAGDKKAMSSAFGTVYSAAPLGVVLSPAVGGLLLNWFQIRELFLFSLLFFTISTIVLFLIRHRPASNVGPNSKKLEIPRTRLEVAILVLLAGTTVAYSLASPFLPLFYQDRLGLTRSQVQLFGALQSLGFAVFAIWLGKMAVQKNKGGTMAFGFLLAAAGLALMSLVESQAIAVPMVFLFGASRAPGLVGYSILSQTSQGGTRGGRFGVYLTFEQMGFVAGPFLGGLLYTMNPVLVLLSSSVLFASLACLSFLVITPAKQPTTPQAQESLLLNGQSQEIHASPSKSEDDPP